MRIELLAEYPKALPVLREWFEQEWAPYYGADAPGDVRADLREWCDSLPVSGAGT